MNIAKIGLALGLLVGTAGLASVAYADNLNGSLNGSADCNTTVDQAAQVNDPSCSMNSGHDNTSSQGNSNRG
jgi:hypothetical protein